MPGLQTSSAKKPAATSYVQLTEPKVAPVDHPPSEVPDLRFHVRVPVVSAECLALTPADAAGARWTSVELSSADDPEDAEMMQEFIEFICKAGPTVCQVFLEQRMFEGHDLEILAGNSKLRSAFAAHVRTFGEMMDNALREPAFDAQLHQILKNALAEGVSSQALARDAVAHPGLRRAMRRFFDADPRRLRGSWRNAVFFLCCLSLPSMTALVGVAAADLSQSLSDGRRDLEAILGVLLGLCLASAACCGLTMRNESREDADINRLAAAGAIGEAIDVVNLQSQSTPSAQLNVIGGAPRAEEDSEDEEDIEVVVRPIALQAGEIESLDADDHPDTHNA